MIEYNLISLSDILTDEYNRERIETAFKEFSCRRETDLEDFLVDKAILYEKTNYGKTYLFIDSVQLKEKNKFSIIAYYTIAQRSLDISQLSKKKRRKILGEYPGRDSLNSVPTYLVGQLGRSDNYSSEKLDGKQILNECYNSISTAARVVGGNIIVLECREKMFGKFYENQGFKKLNLELNENGLYTLYKKINFKEYWNR